MLTRMHAVRVGLFAGLVFTIVVGESSAQGQEDETILGQQTFEVEGMRPVGLSPDGNLLAAAHLSEERLCVYTVESFAEQACASTELLRSSLRLEDVAWSPDSTRLVMAERTFQLLKDGDLWVMDAFTGELTDITDDGYEGDWQLGSEDTGEQYAFDVAPAWSPDGESITYSRSSWIGSAFQGNDIVTIPAIGGDATVLVTVDDEVPGVAYMKMRWTPDGQSLYYTAIWPQTDDPRNGIYRYDAATGGTELVLGSHEENGPPALVEVSPTSDRLLFYYPYLAGQFASAEPIYWLLYLDSGEASAVAVPTGAGDSGYVGATTFSPDGTSLLVGTRFSVPDFQLWDVNLESGVETQMVESLPGVMVMDYALPPSWTTSGRIFVTSNI